MSNIDAVLNEPLLQTGVSEDPHRQQLERDYANQLQAIEAYKARAMDDIPSPITNEEENAIAADFIVEMRTRAKDLEKIHKAEKAPWLKGGRVVDGFFQQLISAIEAIGQVITTDQKAYKIEIERKAREAREAEERRRRDEARIAQAEAERLRKEREAAEERARQLAKQSAESVRIERLRAQELERAQAYAAAEEKARDAAAHSTVQASELAQQTSAMKPADFARSRSPTGGSMTTLKEVWKVELVDIEAIPFERLRHHFKTDHVLQALRDYVNKGGRELAGVRIFSDREVVNL